MKSESFALGRSNTWVSAENKVASITRSKNHKQIKRDPWKVRKTGEFAISGEGRNAKMRGILWATSPTCLLKKGQSTLALETLQRAAEELGWKREPQSPHGWHNSLLTHQNPELCRDKPSSNQLCFLRALQLLTTTLGDFWLCFSRGRGLTWGCKCGPWHGSVYPDLGGSINSISFCLPWEWAQGSLGVPPWALDCPFCAAHGSWTWSGDLWSCYFSSGRWLLAAGVNLTPCWANVGWKNISQ